MLGCWKNNSIAHVRQAQRSSLRQAQRPTDQVPEPVEGPDYKLGRFLVIWSYRQVLAELAEVLNVQEIENPCQ